MQPVGEKQPAQVRKKGLQPHTLQVHVVHGLLQATEMTCGGEIHVQTEELIAGHRSVQHPPAEIPQVHGKNPLVQGLPVGTPLPSRWKDRPPWRVGTVDKGKEVKDVEQQPIQVPPTCIPEWDCGCRGETAQVAWTRLPEKIAGPGPDKQLSLSRSTHLSRTDIY